MGRSSHGRTGRRGARCKRGCESSPKEGPAMLTLGLPIIVYGALLAVIVLLVVRCRGLMHGETRHVTRAIWCPVKDRTVLAGLEDEVWDGRRVDIDACSAFS